MHKNKLLFKIAVVISLFTMTNLFPQSKEVINNSEITGIQKLNPEYQKLLDLENRVIYDNSRIISKDSLKKEDVGTIPMNSNEKSPYLAAVLSGLVPGAGEFYTKSYLKSAIFLGVEAGLWIMYAVFEHKGNTQTDFFQNYANQNWDMRKYGAWLVAQGFPQSGGINVNADLVTLRAEINVCEEAAGFSHTLPQPGEQQYYEVIGKYQTFICGWSTANTSVINKNNFEDYHIPQVDYYMTERQKANYYFSNGSLTLTGVIINHVLSLADAVWSTHSFNSRLSAQGFIDLKSRFSVLQNRQVLVPHANLVINF